MFPLYTLPGHWYQICQIYAMPHFINLALIVRAFQTVWGGGLVGCVQGRGLMVCDCHLGLLLHLLMVPVGRMGLCWPGIALSGLWGRGVVTAGCVQGQELSACTPHLPTFILLVSFSDTLLVVLILDKLYDCHFRRLLQS